MKIFLTGEIKMGIKQGLQNNIVNAAVRPNQEMTMMAVVTSSDDSNNICSVRYIDKNGNKKTRENVTVRLYGSGTDWFPAKGDTVILQESNDLCVIIARHVSNYNMDVRSKMELKQDIYSDESGGQDPGGNIY